MQDEGQAGQAFADLPAAVQVELGRGLVITMGGADGDGQGVDAGFGGKLAGGLDFGEGGGIAHGDMADFAFGGSAGGMSQARGGGRGGDVVGIGEPGAVQHDGGVAPVEGVADLFEVFTMVEMQGDRLGAFLGQADQQSAEGLGLAIAEQAGIELQDDRRLFRFGRLDDGDGGFVVGGVEGADGAAGLARGRQNVVHGDQWHAALTFGCEVVWGGEGCGKTRPQTVASRPCLHAVVFQDLGLMRMKLAIRMMAPMAGRMPKSRLTRAA